jgi:hypothetical protein
MNDGLHIGCKMVPLHGKIKEDTNEHDKRKTSIGDKEEFLEALESENPNEI